MNEASEKIVIVNEGDDVIGSTERESARKGDIYRVSVLWIENSRGEALIARRHRSKSHDPLKWGPAVAGTNEVGESYHQNILKEAKEELGLENIKPKLGPKVKNELNFDYFAQIYKLILDKDISEFELQEDEVEEVKWISKDDLRRELKERPEEFTPAMQKYGELFLGE